MHHGFPLIALPKKQRFYELLVIMAELAKLVNITPIESPGALGTPKLWLMGVKIPPVIW